MSATALKLPTEEVQIIDVEKQFVMQNYGRYHLTVERGKGCYLYDAERQRYLDFITGIGVNALGHGHPRLLKALRDQIGQLMHCSNLYYHRYQGPLAERLAEMSGLQRSFFCNSGAEAVEGALKIAKGYGHSKSPDKFEIVALNGSFGGRTLAATAVTGQAKYRQPFEPLIPGVRFVDVNDVAALEAAVNDNTCGILFEPLLGEGGIVEVSRAFAQKASELAKRHDALLIFDEIQCGLGRTGAYFAFQHWNRPTPEDPEPADIHPDVVTAAKPLGGGLPMGVILMNEKAGAILSAGMHGSTFGGGPLVCRAALEFLDVMTELLPMIKEHGVYFRRRLEELALKFDFVVGPRGRGLMVGLELSVPGKWVVPAAQERGLLLNCTAGNILRFLPPYIIERRHIDQAIDALNQVFEQGPPAE
ncbi:MAG: acetylornithine/succinylornithine family transaminase [Acidobacteria bacterium]|nr:acetylornithine/succinylornithine family transaminase [Acidobacteriota bacterium]